MIMYDNFINRKMEVDHFDQMFKFAKEYCFRKVSKLIAVFPRTVRCVIRRDNYVALRSQSVSLLRCDIKPA